MLQLVDTSHPSWTRGGRDLREMATATVPTIMTVTSVKPVLCARAYSHFPDTRLPHEIFVDLHHDAIYANDCICLLHFPDSSSMDGDTCHT